MRNVFDQYSQPENRLTHALCSALEHEPTLLRPFLKWLGVKDIPHEKKLQITEQGVPGSPVEFTEDKQKGLPDATIYDDQDWAVLFECKVQDKPRANQLKRHRKTAARYGFKDAQLIVISVDEADAVALGADRVVLWRDIYQWFGRHKDLPWAKILLEYMRVFEQRYVREDYEIRGTITVFDGLQFDNDFPYTYGEGKRLIRLLREELQHRTDLKKVLGIDPSSKGRSAITGRGTEGVWDFIPLAIAKKAKSFTDYPHLTLSIRATEAVASVTVPNGVKGGFKTRLKEAGPEAFQELIGELEEQLAPTIKKSQGARPMAYLVQRHFKSQRSMGEEDGRLEFDLRTLSGSGRVKQQAQWVDALYDLLIEKRSNMQLGVQVRFSYECPIVQSAKAVDLFAQTWLALKPLLDYVLNDE